MKFLKQITLKKVLSLSIFALMVSTCIYCFSTTFLERSSYDTMTKLAANKIGSDKIINVVIDSDSIKEISSWPWKRTLYADMFDFLDMAGAKYIVFDAILPNQLNQQDDEEFLKRIKNKKNLTVGIEFSKNENLKNTNEIENYVGSNFSINVTDKRTPANIRQGQYVSFQTLFPHYINFVQSIGGVNTTLDDDGVVRAFEPIMCLNGKYYPSLPLAAYIKLNNIREIILYNTHYTTISKDGLHQNFPLIIKNGKSLQYIKWLAPYDKESWVPHEQVKALTIIKSYKNVKEGKSPSINPDKFKDKIVVIGATSNTLYDLKITPMTVNMPGSAIQTTAIDNLLSAENVVIANHITNISIIILFMVITYLLIYYMSPLVSLISILLVGFIYFYLALFSYSKGFAINMVTPYIFYVLSIIVAYSHKFSIEDHKKEKLQSAMKKYINTTVVDDIIKNTDKDIKLGGKKTEITVLMADIRGFTKFSENLDPDNVTLLLNEYFSIMIPIIEKYKGAINKFIGDAILAVFNEPIKDKQHPKNAILCANEMLLAVRELRKKWKNEGKPNIGISIGINTGTAFIGNIGTPNHMEYTVIGDTVNVASRIEAQNRQFNTQILISDSTYKYAKDILDVIKISSVEIRGREQHMDIYEIIKILDNNETN